MTNASLNSMHYYGGLAAFLPNRYTKTDGKLSGKNLLSVHAVDYLTRGMRCRKSPYIHLPGRPR
jgi:hypothetical protein